MTDKDYKLLASVVLALPNDIAAPLDCEQRNSVAINLAVALQQDNPDFRFDVFLRDCGVH